ncbi:hypothetical protein PHYPSEUDO_001695 [Phytophthora pseudosyringae]|uniref:RxLR effector protein n=1 Tax=Phytophthora pseudosyringae TaxID=221518 RepID=A0A8T1VWC5_9STRA|nr:hypothetical protein PHYPSEUDO_001695 [Phytophthora pseudosyringae]
MRLRYVFFATLVASLAGATNVQVSASDGAKMMTSGPPTSAKALGIEVDAIDERRHLRYHTSSGGDNFEQSSNDASEETRNTLYTTLFPTWYAAGKTPTTVFAELKNPTISHKNWPIYKSYKTYYDTYHIVYP